MNKLKIYFDEVNSKKTLFVSGSNRSGTTLLSNVLSAHEKIVSCPESSFLINQRHYLKKKRDWQVADVDKALRYLWIQKRIMSRVWRSDMEQIRKVLNANLQRLTIESYSKVIYSSYPKDRDFSEITYFADKSPYYINVLGELPELFPEAKFLFIVRDYRDRYCSFKKLDRFGPIRIPMIRGLNWYNQQKVINGFVNENSRAIIIRYEDLINETEKILKKVCTFLDIDFDKKMLSHIDYTSFSLIEETSDDRFDPSHFKKMHKASIEAISDKSIGQFQEMATEKELMQLEYVCGDLGEEFGYPKMGYERPRASVRFQSKLFLRISKAYPKLHMSFTRLPLWVQNKMIQILRKILLKRTK